MQARDLFEKVARQQPLSPPEMDEWLRLGQSLEEDDATLRNWTQTGKGEAKLHNPTINQPVWTGSPLNSAVFVRSTNTNVSSSDATAYVTFETETNSGKVFKLDTDKSYLDIRGSYSKNISMMIATSITANATGFRAVVAEGYDKDKAFVAAQTILAAPGFAGNDNIWTAFLTGNFSIFSFVKFRLYQNSGSTLVSNYFNLMTFEI